MSEMNCLIFEDKCKNIKDEIFVYRTIHLQTNKMSGCIISYLIQRKLYILTKKNNNSRNFNKCNKKYYINDKKLTVKDISKYIYGLAHEFCNSCFVENS